MTRDSFIIYKDWVEMIYSLPNDFFEEMVRAIFDYGIKGEEKNSSPMVRALMKLIKPVIDRNNDKYLRQTVARRENGRHGGRPPKQKTEDNNKNNQEPNRFSVITKNQELKEKNQEPVYVNVNDNVNGNVIPTEAKASSSAHADVEDINYQGLITFYNKICETCNLVRCVKLTDRRREAIRARIKELGKHKVAEAIKKASQSSFLNGHNDHNWRADFEFIFNANKIIKILEGRYDDNQQGGSYGNATGNNSTIQQGKKYRQEDALTRVNRLISESDAEMARRQKEATNGLQPDSTERDLFQ